MNFVLSMSIRMLNGNEFLSLKLQTTVKKMYVVFVVTCHPHRFKFDFKDLHEAQRRIFQIVNFEKCAFRT